MHSPPPCVPHVRPWFYSRLLQLSTQSTHASLHYPNDPGLIPVPLQNVIAEESHVMPIFNDAYLYIVFRTSQGYLGSALSQVQQL